MTHSAPNATITAERKARDMRCGITVAMTLSAHRASRRDTAARAAGDHGLPSGIDGSGHTGMRASARGISARGASANRASANGASANGASANGASANGASGISGGAMNRGVRSAGPQGDLPKGTNPADTLCHVLAGQRRASDILDIGAEPKVLQTLAPVELMAPSRPPNFAPMTFPVGKHFDRGHLARGVDRDGIGNHVLASEDLVHEHVPDDVIAAHRLPSPQRAMRGLRPRQLGDGLLLVRVQGQNHLLKAVRLAEKAALGRVDGHVIGRDSHLGRRNDERSNA